MDGNFNKSDFDKLKFRVDLIDILSCDIIHSFPELKYFPEFGADKLAKLPKVLKFTQVFTYICYTYDFNSPYVKAYDSLLKRKKMACNAALFKRQPNGEFVEDVTEMILCGNEIINAMIIRFLRVLKNIKWGSMIAYLEAKLIADKSLIDAKVEPKDRKISMDTSTTLEKNISRLQQEIFEKEDNPNLIISLYDSIEDEEIFTPEFVALKQFQRENLPFCNPYTNKIPAEEYMRLQTEGESTFEWDNYDLVPKEKSEQEDE